MTEIARVGAYSFKLHSMMVSARERCRLLSESERLLGYVGSADTYKQMACEVESLALWASQEERRLHEVSEPESDGDHG